MARQPHRPTHAEPEPGVRKRIAFDDETYHALRRLSTDSMKTIQELADEAFSDLLKKHHRPVMLEDALRQSARATGRGPTPRRGKKR